MTITTELQAACDLAGCTLIEKGPGHYHIQGKRLVNYWPTSKTRTAHVAGEPARKHVAPAEAVAMACQTHQNDASGPKAGELMESTTWTIQGRLVSEEEFRAHKIPDQEGLPWEKPADPPPS